MQATASRLRETLKLLQPVVPRNPAHKVLRNALFQDGLARATNLEVEVSLDFPEAGEPVLIPLGEVLDNLGFVNGSLPINVEFKGKNLIMTWQGGKSTYVVNSAPEDYPGAADAEEKSAVSIEGDRFVSTMMAMIDYCALEDNRPILQGVSLSVGESMEIAASDGFRLVYEQLPIACPEERRMIVPMKSVQILHGLWNKAPKVMPVEEDLIRQITVKRQLSLAYGADKLKVSFGPVSLTTKLISGDFPAYKKLIPEEPPTKLRVFASDLSRALKSTGGIGRKSHDRADFSWTENKLTISVSEGETGEIEAEIDVQVDGSPGEVAINRLYLLSYLKDKEGLMTMGIGKTKSAPVLLRHGNSPPVVLMPMMAPDKVKSK